MNALISLMWFGVIDWLFKSALIAGASTNVLMIIILAILGFCPRIGLISSTQLYCVAWCVV